MRLRWIKLLCTLLFFCLAFLNPLLCGWYAWTLKFVDIKNLTKYSHNLLLNSLILSLTNVFGVVNWATIWWNITKLMVSAGMYLLNGGYEEVMYCHRDIWIRSLTLLIQECLCWLSAKVSVEFLMLIWVVAILLLTSELVWQLSTCVVDVFIFYILIQKYFNCACLRICLFCTVCELLELLRVIFLYIWGKCLREH